MARRIMLGLALAAAALGLATASFADDKPPADVVRAIRMTVKAPTVQAPDLPKVQFASWTERVCFLDTNVACKLAQPNVIDLIEGVAQASGADAQFDEKTCTMVANLAKTPKSELPSGLKIEEIDVPGPLARKAFALAELNALRAEMMRDIAKHGIDAGVLHAKK